jgi:AIG2-like family
VKKGRDPKDQFRYFAYGSNMCTARLRSRVPSATPIGVGYVQGYHLRWHKKSRDGSGKCDIELTGKPEDLAYGVIFEIEKVEKRKLDGVEGLGNGYEQKNVDVKSASGTISATTYYATSIDPTLPPFDWYKSLVVAGAREHRLPVAYRKSLEAVKAVKDPDSRRAKEEMKVFKSCR